MNISGSKFNFFIVSKDLYVICPKMVGVEYVKTPTIAWMQY